MGYMRHHAIVVTSWNDKTVIDAHKVAVEIFPWVSPISPEGINGHVSFLIPPDGSKEGWPSSDEGDERRTKFIKWVDAQAYDDGSNSIDYVEVFYGDDERQVGVERASNSEMPNPE